MSLIDKMPKKTEKEKKYNREYDKTHYKMYGLKADFELSDKIEDYCISHEITKSDLLRRSVLYVIDNDIDLQK